MRRLILKDKIEIFKLLMISKIVHLAIITKVPNTVIEQLKQIQKNVLWDNKKVKIKQNSFKECRYRTWVKWLYAENFHE